MPALSQACSNVFLQLRQHRLFAPAACRGRHAGKVLLLVAALVVPVMSVAAQEINLTIADSVGSHAVAGATVTFTIKATFTQSAVDELMLAPQSTPLTQNQITSSPAALAPVAYSNQTVTGSTDAVLITGDGGNSLTFTPTLTAPTTAGSTFAYSASAKEAAAPVLVIVVVGPAAPIFTVTTLADDTTATPLHCITGSTVACTLRDAVSAANFFSNGGAMIAFAANLSGSRGAPAVLTLTNGWLQDMKSITLVGPGADVLQISGNNNSPVFFVMPGATLNASGLTLTEGSNTSGTYGLTGGLILNGGAATLTDMSLTNSQASVGGAIFHSSPNAITLLRVTLSGNTATQGGAIYAFNPITLTDCTLTGNEGGSGGAIYGTSVMLQSSTVSGNNPSIPSQSAAGGIYANTVTLNDSIVAGNAADTSYPDIQATVTATGSFYGTSSSAATAPLLAPLGYYGGHTQTMPPLPGSPALCLGVQNSTLPATDQRGFPSTTTYGNTICVDAGSAQTNYTLAVTGPTSTVSGETLLNPIAQADLRENGNTLAVLGSSNDLTTPSAATLSVANGTLTGGTTTNTVSASLGAYLFNVKLTTSAATDNLIASLPLTTTGVTPAVVLTANGIPFQVSQPVATTLTVSASPSTGVSTAGGRSILTATVLDQNGQPFAGATVTAATSGSAVLTAASATTNSAGQATFTLTDATAETASVTLTSGAFSKQATVTFAAPVTYTVLTSATDNSTGTCVANAGSGSGNCTLRVAVADNNAAGGGNTINFSPNLGSTIILSGTQIEIAASVTILGPGANALLIGGNGGSRIFQIDAGVTANISGLTLIGGNGTGALSSGNGGAIYSAGDLNFSAAAVTFSTASGRGGGIYQDASGTLTLTSSTLSGNTANGPGGGGLFCAGTCNLNLSTISGNSAQYGQGGGISSSGPTPVLDAVTVSANTAQNDGGVYAAILKNSIIEGNTASVSAYDYGSITDAGGNFAGGNPVNPKLAPLGYYGGTTQTQPPLPGSPALCAGTQANLLAASATLIDQRGARHSAAYCTQGSQVDVGAVQTNYTSVQFVQQPTNVTANTSIAPAPTVTLTENGSSSVGAAIGMAVATTGDIAPNGQPALSGTTPQTTSASGLATFGDLKLSKDGANLGLIASAAITSSYTLAATSKPFDVYNSAGATYFFNTVTDNAGSKPYPGDVVTLVATTTNLGAANFSPTLTVTLPTGLSFASVPSNNYPYGNCFPASSTSVTCTPTGNTSGLFASGASESVTIQATVAATAAIGLTLPVTLTTSDPNSDPGNTGTDTLTVSVITVTTLADDAAGTAGNCTGSGTCTLRDAVAVANAAASGTTPTITFASALSGTQAQPSTITLLNGQLELSHSVTIIGPGADLLSISGNTASRIFQIDSGSTSTVSGLTLTKGNGSSGNGGAISNQGTLSLTDTAVTANAASGTGGGISNAGTLTLVRVAILGNSAANGGGLFNSGIFTMLNSTLHGNSASGTGGAIDDVHGINTVSDTTLTGNTAAGNSGGASVVGEEIYTNTVLAGNAAPSNANFLGGYIDNGGNILNTPYSSTPTYTTAQLNFAPLGYYGGHTMTLPALPGSVALCAGVATAGNGYTLPATDQRSDPRTSAYGSTTCVDAGAVETNYGLSIATQPGNDYGGMAVPGPLSILLTESGTPFLGAAVTIPLTLNGPGTLTNGSQPTTTTTGIATYTNLFIDTPSKTDTLTAKLSIGQVTLSATTNAFLVDGPAVSLAFTTAPPAKIPEGSNPGTVVVGQFDAAGTQTYYYYSINSQGNGFQNPITLTVTDSSGNVYYTSTVNTNTAGAATFNLGSLAYTASGTYTFTASSAVIGASTKATVTVTAGPTAALKVTGLPNPDAVSAAGTVTVTAQDSAGNTMPGFTGTVTLTSTDLAATLPAAYTFTAADMGIHTFNVTLNTAGMQSITATTGSGATTITGSETAILVTGSTWLVNANGSVVRLNGNGTALAITTTANAAGTLGGIAIDNAGDAWAVTNGNNSIVEVGPSGTLAGTFTAAGLNTPTAVAIDGLGMVWVANGNNSVSVLAPSGAAVSPTTGYQSPTFNAPSAIAIDQTGSVWITNSGSTTVTRIFGAAAPVVTPIVTGTTNGTTGARP